MPCVHRAQCVCTCVCVCVVARAARVGVVCVDTRWGTGCGWAQLRPDAISAPRLTSVRPAMRARSWAAARTHSALPCTAAPSGLFFRQLFDRESCTYTYLLADEATHEGVLIDPVDKLAQRDADMAAELGIKVLYALETHAHADHITGGYNLRALIPDVKTVISKASGEWRALRGARRARGVTCVGASVLRRRRG